jgi:hypothetical protein
MKGTSKVSVFISYSRTDFDRVSKLYAELKRASFDPWMDRADIGAGEWRTAIRRGLRRSNFFVACLSRSTQKPGEVLQFEWDSALEIQKEQLEGEVYLLPVRLEPCDVPEKFRPFQWVDIFEPDGPERLRNILDSKRDTQTRPKFALWMAAALLLFGVPAAWWWASGRSAPSFVEFRPGGKNPAGANENFMLGVTLWKLRKPLPGDPPFARYFVLPPPTGQETKADLVPVRLPWGDLRQDDKVFFTVESSRNGYLYVADRELHTDGSKGPPVLIFPAGRINGGGYAVFAGHSLEVPDRYTNPNYFQVRAGEGYAGEELTFFVTPRQLPEIHPGQEPQPLLEATVAEWERQWISGVRPLASGAKPALPTLRESKALTSGEALASTDPPPEAIYSARRTPQGSLAIHVNLTAAGQQR